MITVVYKIPVVILVTHDYGCFVFFDMDVIMK